jgi:hypothetical protein
MKETVRMLEIGKLVPNIPLTLPDGSRRSLWDFRQKSHVLVLVGAAAAVRDAAQRLAERKKTLVWLNLEVVPTAQADGLPAGAHAVDRYGDLVGSYVLDDTLADRVEKDFIYYEACHC